ncbi:TPA: hypothetical protein I8Y00_004869 [Citrobacter farmeri]|uniref:Uncharacterized protein n=1 Tax=Citrobacter farmeri TaxID=67824 RepID=A0A8H9NZL5_9ENTR|nr:MULTISPECIES: hypothetical protein [Enterobacteriaceae]EHK0947598.1 hypothetical protein [Citrobacter farmeri]EKT9197052.1 hypothetical protein [Citrobacter freundii]EKX4542942.1 hypothetical protein [Citrobacter farmeri]EKX4543938.1 hypothetical protein [Citrobacter farmeri]ELK7730782.1 hypothetical protein [Citrobacter freundii]
MIRINKNSLWVVLLYAAAAVGGGYLAHIIFIRGFDYPITPYFVYPMFTAVGLFIAMLFTGEVSLKDGILGDVLCIMVLLMGVTFGMGYGQHPVTSSPAERLFQDFVDLVAYVLHVCAIFVGSGHIYYIAASELRERFS